MPCAAPGSVRKVMRSAADSKFTFEEIRGFFRGMRRFLIVQKHPELAVLNARTLAQRIINFRLRYRKSGGFFVLRLFNRFYLLFYGW